LKKYGPRAQLLFTDTDSLCYSITTDDLYEDLLPLNDEWFDTSQYPKDHILQWRRHRGGQGGPWPPHFLSRGGHMRFRPSHFWAMETCQPPRIDLG